MRGDRPSRAEFEVIDRLQSERDARFDDARRSLRTTERLGSVRLGSVRFGAAP